MNVFVSNYGEPSRYRVFHLRATNGLILCRKNTKVPNAVGRRDLGGFALSQGDPSTPANFRLTAMSEREALQNPALCGRCRVSSRIRDLDETEIGKSGTRAISEAARRSYLHLIRGAPPTLRLTSPYARPAEPP